MFGFGFGKLLVLAAIVALVWYGFKFVGRMDRQRKRKVEEDKKKSADSIGEMEKCRVCGTYVVAGRAENCGRQGCPY
ncbi:MAG: hypothetical protein PVG24_10330 [Gammaproteobacteria bacterium]|jgi:uncharacterized protein